MSDDLWLNRLLAKPPSGTQNGLLDSRSILTHLLGQYSTQGGADVPGNALLGGLSNLSAGSPHIEKAAAFRGWPTVQTRALASARMAPRRHVFFSFHFQSDIHRVNIVRNSWRIRPEDYVPGFFDRSLWERKKRTDIDALKRMIRAGLKGTSVTCVLAGEFTWARPWVRYEIAESVAQGNGLLTVDIDELRCMRTRAPCAMGPNPLDYMGVYRAEDYRAYVCELTDSGWMHYDKLAEAVAWPAYLPDRGTVNDPHALSLGTKRHAYRSEKGYVNLTRWVREAAQSARRR